LEAEIGTLTLSDTEGEKFCYQAMFPDNQCKYNDPLLMYKAVSDPDSMYYHKAMKEPDRAQFQEEGMLKEVTNRSI
jgi:hypothetical protein